MTVFFTELDQAIYDELRAVAHRRLRSAGRTNDSGTLNTTALVHEAYLKLAGREPGRWNDRGHFLSSAAVAMRHILIDRARARAAEKRGGQIARVDLDADALAASDEAATMIEIDDALERVRDVSPRLAQIVVLRFYGGLTDDEIAAALALTRRTVQRDWVKARMLLQRALAH